MKKYIRLFFFMFIVLLKTNTAFSDPEKFKVGVFLINISDINFIKQEFSATFLIWFLHSGKHQSPEELFEIVNSKDLKILHRSKHKISSGETLTLAKVSTTVIERWHLEDFPFDTHKLQIMVEVLGNSTKSIVYEKDCENSFILSKMLKESLGEWDIINYDIPVANLTYPSSFGNPVTADYDSFSTITPTLYIKRDWVPEFIRLFLVLYFSFFIAALTLLISNKHFKIKTTLSSISIATIIVSKFVVDGYLPASGGFSLYSTLESITLWIIFFIITFEVIRVIRKKDPLQTKTRLYSFLGFSCFYVVLNTAFIFERYLKYSNAFEDITVSCNNNLIRKRPKLDFLKEANLSSQEIKEIISP